ncbi:hypothetical protein [Psychroserpens damuponensis]|uniref:hypothetical protein n=1 Tax=Psychroserpens damuponensis TaxID=943936 RepID=UPI00058FAAFF|nr:hypothetical protein [Psychroserpens damuponensis]
MNKFGLQNIRSKDVLISILIVCVTMSYYSNNILDIQGNISEFDFYSFWGLFHFSKMKILIIAFCLIWYFTSKHWWRHSILIIISIELVKLISTLNPNQDSLDEIEFITSLPITIPIILMIFLVSHKLNQYRLAQELKTNIDIEIDEVFLTLKKYKKTDLDTLQEKVTMLKAQKLHKKEAVNYLNTLKALRDEFYKI